MDAARKDATGYGFLIATYEQERVKTANVWSQFPDEHLAVRPRQGDPRGRSVREQMVPQCLSEVAGGAKAPQREAGEKCGLGRRTAQPCPARRVAVYPVVAAAFSRCVLPPNRR